MAQLQRPRQSHNQRRINITQTPLPLSHIFRSVLKLIFQDRGRERLGGDSTGQRRIVVDVEFEEVEEGVVDEVDCAVDFLFDAEVELERAAGLVACECWDVGELAGFVGDVFACVTVFHAMCEL